jgi:hypothetical protein
MSIVSHWEEEETLESERIFLDSLFDQPVHLNAQKESNLLSISVAGLTLPASSIRVLLLSHQ